MIQEIRLTQFIGKKVKVDLIGRENHRDPVTLMNFDNFGIYLLWTGKMRSAVFHSWSSIDLITLWEEEV